MNPDGIVFKALTLIDLILSIVFLIECTIKIIAFGFLFCGPDSYMRSSWNALDFIITIFSIFPLAFHD